MKNTEGMEKNRRTFKDSNHNKHADAAYLCGKNPRIWVFMKLSDHAYRVIVTIEMCLSPETTLLTCYCMLSI